MHATELIRLAGVHEFIEERGIGAINLIRRFAEQASLDSRFNYRLPITSPCHIYLPFRSISYSLRLFSFYFFFSFRRQPPLNWNFALGNDSFKWCLFDERRRKEKAFRKWKTCALQYFGNHMNRNWIQSMDETIWTK